MKLFTFLFLFFNRDHARLHDIVREFRDKIYEFGTAEDVAYFLAPYLKEHMHLAPRRGDVRGIILFSKYFRAHRLLMAVGFLLGFLGSSLVTILVVGGALSASVLGAIAGILLILILIDTPLLALSTDDISRRELPLRTVTTALLVLAVVIVFKLSLGFIPIVVFVELGGKAFWFKLQQYRLKYYDSLQESLWNGFLYNLSYEIYKRPPGYDHKGNNRDYYQGFVSELNDTLLFILSSHYAFLPLVAFNPPPKTESEYLTKEAVG